MITNRQASDMAMLIVFVIVLVAGVLSVAFGGGDLNDRDRRGWWPGAKRR
jgi:hypothetical protein